MLLGLHGFTAELGEGIEPVAVHGNDRTGQVLAAEHREPRWSVSWTRSDTPADPQRTLDAAIRRLVRRDGCTGAATPAGDGARSIAGPGGRWCVGHRRSGPLDLVVRSLCPRDPEELRAVVTSIATAGEHQPWRWRIHGLELDLASTWRLEGLEHLVGLARGVWFHRVGHRSPDGILVERRFACATRLLAGAEPAAWLAARLKPGERIAQSEGDASGARVTVDAPARTWWARWRGRREPRWLSARVDPASDRLTVRERLGPAAESAGW